MFECAFKNSSIPLCGLNSHERRLRVPTRFKSGFWCTLGSFQDIVRDQAKLVYLSTLFKIKKKSLYYYSFYSNNTLFMSVEGFTYGLSWTKKTLLNFPLENPDLSFLWETGLKWLLLPYWLSNIYFPSSKQIGKKNP